MKIIQINDVVYKYASGDPSANGGSERYQWLLARALAKAGCTVSVGVHRALEPGNRTTIDGVEFVGIGNGSALQSVAAWRRFLLAERPDWWFWQCADHWLGPAFALAKLAGVKTIFSAMHDRDVQIRRALFRRPRLWPLYAMGVAGSDRIFVQHGEQLSQLPSRWRARATILPGIVSQPPTIRPHCDRKPYVAWVGVLREPKRPDLLLEIADKASGVEFVVCGGPSSHRSPSGYGEKMTERLEALPNVEYMGHVPPEQALRIIGAAALLLSTSGEEGFPSVFLEAWARGTPVVSLTIDPDHFLERKGLGRLSGNVDRAVSDIEALMASPNEREEIAARARQHVAENHSEKAAVAVFERAVRQAGATSKQLSSPAS